MPFVAFCMFGLLSHGSHGKTSRFGENFAHLTQLVQTVYDISEKFFPGAGLDLVHPGAGSLIGSRPRHLGPVFRMNKTMRKFCLALALVAGLSAVADAGPFHRRGRAVAVCTTGTCQQTAQVQVTQKTVTTTTTSTLSAQNAAIIIAREGRLRHLGGHGGFEGIGFSTVSPDAAIANCCYWGRRQPVEIATARGSTGWFAVVRYR